MAAASAHRGLAHAGPQLVVERRARALLDQLLVPALHRAIPLAQVNDPAVGVAQHLDLDVAGPGEVLLDVDVAVAEGRERLVLGQGEELGELLLVVRDPHPLAAAARGGLDDDRETDPARPPRGPPRRRPACPRNPGTVGTPASLASRRAEALSPICRICSPVGPDEGDVRRPAGVGELGVLGQEPVARDGWRRRR